MGRLQYIDILKGWSILCIMLLHYEEGIFPGWLNAWVGNFMISAFYFTSGWLAGIRPRDITVKELAKKRWQTLGKPYFYFSILILAFDLILFAVGYYDLKFIARELYKTITIRGIGTLWFLPALFGGEIIFRWILNKNNRILLIVTILLSLIIIHYYYYFYFKYRNVSDVHRMIEAPLFTIRNIILAWPIIYIGYALGKHIGAKLSNSNIYGILTIGIIITGISIYYNGGFCPFSFGIVTPLIVPVIGPFGLLLLAYPIKGNNIAARFLSFWGVNSLVMMVTHYSITLVLCKIIDQHLFHLPFTGVKTLIWFAISVFITYPIAWFFNNKAKWMLGKG